ncbi:shikimate dehydrogenase [uncultured Rothia sp.]|uniref:shikimate dehydrogenase n=1 Tax=uncultured Rothia sp. TaxID=316088 RepID=UPI0032179A2F
MSHRGESYLVGLLGSGIQQSLTPPMHEYAADLAGLRYLYRPIDTDVVLPQISNPADSPRLAFGKLFSHTFFLGYSALNITHPFKQTVLDYLDEISPEALHMGAANTVIFKDGKSHGYNTDYSGFSSALLRCLPHYRDRLQSVVQLGAGGAGAATAYALLRLGVHDLFLFDIDLVKARHTAKSLQQLFPTSTLHVLTSADLKATISTTQGLINASPIGMHIHPGTPIDLSFLHSQLWVADVIYLPQQTPLISAASALGCDVMPGGMMAVGQALDAFKLITGITPDPQKILSYFNTLIHDHS